MSSPDRHQRRRSVTLAGLLGAVLVAVLVAACGSNAPVQTSAPSAGTSGSGQPSAPAAGRAEITIALVEELSSLESHEMTNDVGSPVLRNVFETLVARDPKTNALVPGLATAWNQVDPTTWEFELRTGVKFHDGSAFDAEAAAESLNFVWSEEKNFPLRQDFMGPQVTFEAAGPSTLRVTTVEPDPLIPERMYMGPVSSPVQLREAPDEYVTNPIGTGPFVFSAWNRGQSIVLEKNPDWWGDQAGLVDTATYVFRAEDQVRADMIRTDEAQFALGLGIEQCSGDLPCKSASSLTTPFIRIDQRAHPALADLRVRQAIASAIDMTSVAGSLFGAEPAVNLVSPAVAGHNPDLQPYPADANRVEQLLDEARAAGVPVDQQLLLAAREDVPQASELVQSFGSMLQSAGFNVKAEVIERQRFREMWSQQPIPADRGMLGILHHGNELMDLSLSAHLYYSCDGDSSAYCDEGMDAAIAAADPLTGDPRASAFRDISAKAHDEVAVIPIVHLLKYYGVAPSVSWEPRLDGLLYLTEMRVTE